MPTHEAREIARKLTKAQADALINQRPIRPATMQALKRLGLVDVNSELWPWTDLGRAVAAALREGGDTA